MPRRRPPAPTSCACRADSTTSRMESRCRNRRTRRSASYSGWRSSLNISLTIPVRRRPLDGISEPLAARLQERANLTLRALTAMPRENLLNFKTHVERLRSKRRRLKRRFEEIGRGFDPSESLERELAWTAREVRRRQQQTWDAEAERARVLHDAEEIAARITAREPRRRSAKRTRATRESGGTPRSQSSRPTRNSPDSRLRLKR